MKKTTMYFMAAIGILAISHSAVAMQIAPSALETKGSESRVYKNPRPDIQELKIKDTPDHYYADFLFTNGEIYRLFKRKWTGKFGAGSVFKDVDGVPTASPLSADEKEKYYQLAQELDTKK